MMEQRSGRTHVRLLSVDSDDDLYAKRITHPPQGSRRGRPKDAMRTSYPQPPLTPNVGALPTPLSQPISNPLLPSAPASPPTPAPSPTPHQRPAMWPQMQISKQTEDYHEPMLRDFCSLFGSLSVSGKEQWMAAVVDTLDNHMLNYVKHLVSPRLKKDPFAVLPNELCFKILEHVDNPQTLVRASQVSHRWREILNDDAAWKAMCDKHAYRRASNASLSSLTNSPLVPSNHFYLDQLPHASSHDPTSQPLAPAPAPPHQHHSSHSYSHPQNYRPTLSSIPSTDHPHRASASSSAAAAANGACENSSSSHHHPTAEWESSAEAAAAKNNKKRPRITHRSHFKHRFMVESAWRKGGQMTARHITPDQGVVTSLHLTPQYIVLSMDTARIHVFDVKGNHLRMLQGHIMGVWAMVPWGDTLVSGGCDRDVRVWNMATG